MEFKHDPLNMNWYYVFSIVAKSNDLGGPTLAATYNASSIWEEQVNKFYLKFYFWEDTEW